MICPVCSVDGDPVALVGGVGICVACGTSVNFATQQRAVAADIDPLTPAELVLLRQARGKIKQGKRAS